MTTATLYLSSNITSTVIYYSPIHSSCPLTLNVDVGEISLDKSPISIKISWGDNTAIEEYFNDYFTQENVVNQVLYGFDYSIIRKYSHEYGCSTSALTRNLSCQFLVTYFDGTSCRFVQPISLYTPSFTEKIGDLYLLQTNIVDTDYTTLYTMYSDKGSRVIESLHTPSI
jgi:hypothetical protein